MSRRMKSKFHFGFTFVCVIYLFLKLQLRKEKEKIQELKEQLQRDKNEMYKQVCKFNLK